MLNVLVWVPWETDLCPGSLPGPALQNNSSEGVRETMQQWLQLITQEGLELGQSFQSCPEAQRPRLCTPALISHWMWTAPRRGCKPD